MSNVSRRQGYYGGKHVVCERRPATDRGRSWLESQVSLRLSFL